MKMRIRLTRNISEQRWENAEGARREAASQKTTWLERLGRGGVRAAGRLEVGRRKEACPGPLDKVSASVPTACSCQPSHWPSQPCSPWVSEAGSWSLVPWSCLCLSVVLPWLNCLRNTWAYCFKKCFQFPRFPRVDAEIYICRNAQ